MTDHNELVRERAYLLWEKAGCPDDRSLEFWFAAVLELEAEQPPLLSPPVAEPEVAVEEPAKAPVKRAVKSAAE